MYEQTDFSTFSTQKAQKGRYSQKNAIKGDRNGLFQKGPKRAKKGRHLGKGLEDRRFDPIVERSSAGSASAVSRQCCCAHSPQR